MGTPHKPSDPNGCWGEMARCNGYCYKKPRPGKLTCSWHRDQERQAERLKLQYDKDAADSVEEKAALATTCFHCGDPALPRTYGEGPRCERHRDV